MASFDEAFARLSSLTNYERKKPGRPHRFDLGGMRELCRRLGNPELRLGRVVQVAGSKGKGTVVSLLAGMARAVGIRAASYLSPHVVDVRERVRIDGRMVNEDELAESLEAVTARMSSEQTWFEAFTAAALTSFSRARPELTVLEVGLGGRLDSTTVVPKQACCITNIELEHTHVLGETPVRIAHEKAGILAPGVPCVTGASGVALGVIEDRCRALGCPLSVLGRDFTVDIVGRSRSGLELRLVTPAIGGRVLSLPIYGRVHAISFALATTLFSLLFPHRAADVLAADPHAWLEQAMPPARFQILAWDPPLVVDGAHTDESLDALAQDLALTFPQQRFKLVFAIALGKRWRRGLGRLAALVDRAWVPPLAGKAGVSPADIRRFLEERGVQCVMSPSVAAAVAGARSGHDGRGLLVTGSLYAAGDALAALRSESRP